LVDRHVPAVPVAAQRKQPRVPVESRRRRLDARHLARQRPISAVQQEALWSQGERVAHAVGGNVIRQLLQLL
jgi:hypothetical protein